MGGCHGYLVLFFSSLYIICSFFFTLNAVSLAWGFGLQHSCMIAERIDKVCRDLERERDGERERERERERVGI